MTGHSKKYDMVKNYYDKGLWSIDRVARAVEKHYITEEEFYEITGMNY